MSFKCAKTGGKEHNMLREGESACDRDETTCVCLVHPFQVEVY